MNYKYNEELGIFEVEEEVVVELKDVKTWFETFEDIADELEREDICLPFDEVIREDEDFLESIVDKVNKRCNITNKYVSEIAIKEFIGDLTPINNFLGDNMKNNTIKIYNNEELNTMTDEQFDALGCIYEENIEEDVEVTYKSMSDVIIALINTFNVDLRSTEAYKQLIKSMMNREEPMSTNLFYRVLYSELFEYDVPLTNFNKDIRIECIVEDASFDYDYGSISSTHHCWNVLGYNIKLEDIEL